MSKPLHTYSWTPLLRLKYSILTLSILVTQHILDRHLIIISWRLCFLSVSSYLNFLLYTYPSLSPIIHTTLSTLKLTLRTIHNPHPAPKNAVPHQHPASHPYTQKNKNKRKLVRDKILVIHQTNSSDWLIHDENFMCFPDIMGYRNNKQKHL